MLNEFQNEWWYLVLNHANAPSLEDLQGYVSPSVTL